MKLFHDGNIFTNTGLPFVFYTLHFYFLEIFKLEFRVREMMNDLALF